MVDKKWKNYFTKGLRPKVVKTTLGDKIIGDAQRHRGARQDARTDIGGELNAGNTLEFTLQMPLGIARNTRDFIQVWPLLQMYLHPLN